MSASTSSSAPESSPPASTAFPSDMVGRKVELFLLHREGRISGVERQEDQERRAATLIKFEAEGGIASGKLCRVETAGGLKFQGTVNVDEASRATVRVADDAVLSCRCCTNRGVPIPPFSSSIKGMTVRFSESDPQTIEATVLTVEKLHSFSIVILEMTSSPPYSAHIGDRIMLRSVLNTWEATVVYFENHNQRLDEVCGENRICIHVEHVPQGPRCLRHTKIVVRPAQSVPSNFVVGLEGKSVSQKKRRSSAYEENEANQKKIRVAINGFRDIGRALARVALDSEDVDLVAINDPSITDQVSCMFWDSKCDFEVSSSRILSFGTKGVNFFQESDPRTVPWYLASTKLVVSSSYSSEDEEKSYEEVASQYSQSPNHKLSGPLEMMLGTSTTAYKWAPIIKIQPITPRDAKAVSDCFPLWKGKRVATKFCFQGVDVNFVLGEYPQYELLPNSTEPSINFRQLVRWCFDMVSRIPAAVCDVEISERPTY